MGVAFTGINAGLVFCIIKCAMRLDFGRFSAFFQSMALFNQGNSAAANQTPLIQTANQTPVIQQSVRRGRGRSKKAPNQTGQQIVAANPIQQQPIVGANPIQKPAQFQQAYQVPLLNQSQLISFDQLIEDF